MKTRLLKKIRKEYNWYIAKDGTPVVLNHNYKTATIIDIEYCCKKAGYDIKDYEKYIEVTKEEWMWRQLKLIILGKYGWSMQHSWYKQCKTKPQL